MLLAALVAVAALAPVGSARGEGEVQNAISAFARANPATSALVWRLDAADTAIPVGSFQPDASLIPASTMKLVTSAGALIELGPDFRFRTHLYAPASSVQRGRVLTGPIYLRGSGDPVLATRAYASRYLPGRATRLAALARPLRAKGIRLVRGAIVADERLFDSRRLGPGWPSYYSAYASPLSALATNQDFAGNGRRSYVTSPPLAAARRLRATLSGFGVTQRGPLRAGAAASGRILATATSPPLRAIVHTMNLDSDNFIAETLAKDVGAYGAGRGTTRAGVGRTAALLRSRGILNARDRLADGSGLSRSNRLSASSLVRLIAAADADSTWGAPLISSLARGGEGTLIRRFRSGPATKRVRAKTGYLNGVSSIAGRVVSRRGQRYAFALLMNSSDITAARATQDRVITLLASGSEDGVASARSR